jgi:hypothetical protein
LTAYPLAHRGAGLVPGSDERGRLIACVIDFGCELGANRDWRSVRKEGLAGASRTAARGIREELSEAVRTAWCVAFGGLWKAGARDEELGEWFDVLRRMSAALAPRNAAYAKRVRAFYDLLQMSINISKVASVSAASAKRSCADGCTAEAGGCMAREARRGLPESYF